MGRLELFLSSLWHKESQLYLVAQARVCVYGGSLYGVLAAAGEHAVR